MPSYDDEFINAMNQTIAMEYGIDLTIEKKPLTSEEIIRQRRIAREDQEAIATAVSYGYEPPKIYRKK